MRIKYAALLLALVVLVDQTQAYKFYTSSEKVRQLVETSFKVVRRLEKFLSEEEDYPQVKPLIEKFKELNNAAIESIPKFIGNPFNSMFLLKQMTVDLNKTISIIKNENIRIAFIGFLSGKFSLPEVEDYEKSISTLYKIQDVYQFTPEEFINEVYAESIHKPYRPITGEDCLMIGKHALKNYDSYHSSIWLMEAEKRLSSLNKTENKELFLELYDALSDALSMHRNPLLAANAAEEMLALDPENQKIEEKLEKYAKQRAEIGRTDEEMEELSSFRVSQSQGLSVSEILCRGDPSPTGNPDIPRFCRYANHGPFVISPLKEEILNERPYVSLYHNILTEKQIDTLKKLARPKLERAGGFAENEFEDSRVSHSCVLNRTEHEIVKYIDTITSQAANLSLKYSEDLYVANFGVGGYYDDHKDFFMDIEPHKPFFVNGNRIATWLFVLEAPEQGGRITFPGLSVDTIPEKGSAYYWPDLQPDGKVPLDMTSMVCPIISGELWTSSKWYRSYGQEFTRPCPYDMPQPGAPRRPPPS